MELRKNQLFYDISCFNDEAEEIGLEDKERIISFCNRLEHYLYENGLICRQYQVYQADWERFINNPNRKQENKTLYELFIYLFIYSRDDYFSGGYGSCYLEAFKKNVIQDILNMVVEKLESMAIAETDMSDKNGNIGIAGEFFVVAELTRRGYVATLTSKNTKSMDVLVSDKIGNNLATVQVKTCDNPNQLKWKLGDKVEENYSSNLYYVFVNMNAGKEPSYYVVPSKYVAYKVHIDYEEWLNTPGKNGHVRKETTMRTFSFVDDEEKEQYKDAWHLLGI